jgi:hypothetical protein
MWAAGLNGWSLRVGVSWLDEKRVALANVVGNHEGLDEWGDEKTVEALARHGVVLDVSGNAWVGQQDVVTAVLGSGLADAAGRMTIQDGSDLAEAADDAAGDLINLVSPLMADPDDEDGLWGDGVLAAYPDANMAQAVILLRSVNITPVLRGHHLGAWAAAQSVALFDQGSSLVATQAAPFEERDAIPGYGQDGNRHRRLSPEESALWKAEQARLAEQWRTQLGLTPLPDEPETLFWYSGHRNEGIKNALAHWAD